MDTLPFNKSEILQLLHNLELDRIATQERIKRRKEKQIRRRVYIPKGMKISIHYTPDRNPDIVELASFYGYSLIPGTYQVTSGGQNVYPVIR
jgi:hypothetical protein